MPEKRAGGNMAMVPVAKKARGEMVSTFEFLLYFQLSTTRTLFFFRNPRNSKARRIMEKWKALKVT